MRHTGLHSHRLAPEQNNPREVAFAQQWQYENDRGPSSQPLIELLIPDCTDRDARVAATVIQWLGSNVGMSFLDETIKRSPDVAKWLKHSVDRAQVGLEGRGG